MAKKIINIAHRGASGNAPENTCSAFSKAIELKADVIELDVHLTKDKKIVVIHDATINRTSNGIGFVHLMTLKELRKYNYNKTNKSKKKELIPTLEDALKTIGNKAYTIVELKLSIKNNEKIVLDIINQSKNKNNIWLHTSHKSIIKNVRKLDKNIRIGYIELLTLFQRFLLHWDLLFARRYKVNFFSIDELLLKKPFAKWFIKRLKRRNVDTYVWVLNDIKSMKEWISWGVEGIITNHPERLRTILNKNNS